MSSKEVWLMNQILRISESRPRGAYAGELIATGRISKRWAHRLLGRLCERGWLLRTEEKSSVARLHGRPPRRYYRISRQGLQALNNLAAA